MECVVNIGTGQACPRIRVVNEHVRRVSFCSLVEELKQQNPDFPEVSSGIYVHEVVPNSPAQK